MAGSLFVDIAIILVAVENLVHSVGVIGRTFGADEFLLGVTILAGATSLPDTLISRCSGRSSPGPSSCLRWG